MFHATTILRAVGITGLCLATLLPLSVQGEETVRFNIVRFEIAGNTLIGADELNRQVEPFVGNNKVYGDIQKALEVIERAYRARGYGAVQVMLPEQELTEGVVHFDVIEAKIGKVTVTGNEYFDQENILSSLPSLKVGAIPEARDISENVQLANENPAKKIAVTLGVGEKEDELEAKVDVKDEKPWAVFLSSDNTGNSATGRDRTGIALQYSNLLNRDHVATMAFTGSVDRPESTRIYSLSYRLPLYGLGDSVDFIVGKSDVAAATSTTVAGPLQFSGSGMVYGLRYNYILPRRGEYSHRLVAGIDQREYNNTCFLAGQAVCGSGGADITIRPVSLTYTGQLDSPGRASLFSVAVSSNLTGGPNSKPSDFAASRLDAKQNYSILRSSLNHTQTVGRDWQLRGALSMQYTNDALVTGEQLGLVGTMAVRGFQERVVTADKGYYGTLEVYTPDMAASSSISGSLRFLGFYDFGRGSFNKTPPGIYNRENVASGGVGLRYSVSRNTLIRGDIARVIDGGPVSAAQAGDWRGHVGVVIGF